MQKKNKILNSLIVKYVKERILGFIAVLITAIIVYQVTNFTKFPILIVALVIGMLLKSLNTNKRFSPGINFCSKTILRIGVALLGTKIVFNQITDLGFLTFITITFIVFLTFVFCIYIAKLLKFNHKLALIAGASVSICGASAALAMSSILPDDKETQSDTLAVIIAINIIGTIAMVTYPIVAKFSGFDDMHIGIFLGASIHEVAQVIGAGISVNENVTNIATIVKLIRVAMLSGIIFFVALSLKQKKSIAATSSNAAKTPIIPFFLIMFFIIMALNSLNIFNKEIISFSSDLSKFCLVMAIVALGKKTDIMKLKTAGAKAIYLVIINTIFIAFISFVAVKFII